MKKLLISMIILFCVVTLFVPNTYSLEVDENNTPIGESVKPFEANNNTTLDEPVINAETFLFPDIGDTRFTLSGSNFWNDGDYVEGMRLFASPSDSVEMILAIEPNVLRCDTQDHALMIDGTTIGNFSVSAGDTNVVQTFSFPAIPAGNHTIRIETVRTVSSGCGSAGFPDGASRFNFSSASVCTNNVALSYTGGRLIMDFTVGSKSAGKWNVLLSYNNTFLPLFSISVPVIVPPMAIPVAFPFPSIGGIGVLTTLTSPGDGIICSDWQTVDTGP